MKIIQTALLYKHEDIIKHDPVLSDLEKRLAEMTSIGNISQSRTTVQDIVSLMREIYPEVDESYVFRAINAYHPTPEQAKEDLASLGSIPTRDIVNQMNVKETESLINHCLIDLRKSLPRARFEVKETGLFQTYVINEVIGEDKFFWIFRTKSAERKPLCTMEAVYRNPGVGITLFDSRFTAACKETIEKYKPKFESMTISHEYSVE